MTSLHRYPIKSGQGEELSSAQVEPWGLAGDRRWMVVDADGRCVTAREVPRLLTVDATITAAGLRLSAVGMPDDLRVARPDPAAQTPVRVFASELTAAEAPPGAAWLSELLGRDVRLVHLDDPTRRPTSPAYSRPGDRVSFADGYPLLITTEASLAALNDEIETGGQDAVPMSRFRPSVVVDGDAAWAEDDWRRIRIGDAVFRAAKGSARCVMTTLDPDPTAGVVHGGKEPLRTLARIRRFGGGVWFGVNLIPDTPGAILHRGDRVEVLDAAAPGGGPVGA